ncbi:FtsB family cell division protein [Mesobacillus harenae]|uniref:FtsB family cell division protein n=1 Tax=Mesobacillus harenae TaxID=2213203 RepID=UPI0015807C72|nr:septum formation initiator family protein [Mesobacillus harenae]
MGARKKRNIAKIQNTYVKDKEAAEVTDNIKRKHLIRRLAVFFVLAGTVTFFMIAAFVSQTSALEQKQLEKSKLEKQIAELNKEQEILEEEIVKLNDDEYIAKLARREYFLSEDNEVIFNLPEKTKEKPSN